MKSILEKIFFALFLLSACCSLSQAQNTLTLKFKGQDQNGQYVKLNNVYIDNLSQLWQEVLYYPDTVLYIGSTGVEELSDVPYLLQNAPNPFDGVTNINLQMREKSDVSMEIFDLEGKRVASYKGLLDQGVHQFRATLTTPQVYLLRVNAGVGEMQLKMVNVGRGECNAMEYLGVGKPLSQNAESGGKGGTLLPFNYGDQMQYYDTAYLANVTFQSPLIVKNQYNSELIPLSFTLPLASVTTLTPSNISTTGALLRGSVSNPDNTYPLTSLGFDIANNNQFSNAFRYTVNPNLGNFSYTVSGLQTNSRYYYRAFAKTSIGIAYGETVVFRTNNPPCSGMATVTDYEGHVYNTVQIGSQCWMRENLKTSYYADGTSISLGSTTSNTEAHDT